MVPVLGEESVMADVQTFNDISYSQQQEVRDKFAEFLKHGSLYQKHQLAVLPDQFKQIVPEVLQLYCDDCERENPFRSLSYASRSRAQPEADVGTSSAFPGTSSETVYGKDLESRVYVIALECKGCNWYQYTFWINVDSSKCRARKVGQIPEPSIEVPNDLRRALGTDDVELYKRAKICANQSFGMAACIYLRRILENRITPLLEIIKHNRREDGADEAELQEIDEIIKGKVAEDKITLIGKILPNSLKVEGDNPLRLAYDELSYGIHSRDEGACAGLARKVLPALNHILIELSSEQRKRESKTEFDKNVKQLRKERTEREVSD
jgi:hypothetical protein